MRDKGTSTYLRAVEDADLDSFYRYQLDAEARRQAAFVSAERDSREAFDAHWARIRSLDTVWIRSIVMKNVIGTGDGRESDQLVGNIARFFRGDQAEVTYWIDRRYWGQGIASSALRRLVDEVSDRPMYGRTVADNIGSRRVLEKCGFQLVGSERAYAEARQAEVEELIFMLRERA